MTETRTEIATTPARGEIWIREDLSEDEKTQISVWVGLQRASLALRKQGYARNVTVADMPPNTDGPRFMVTASK